ncbi:hypothetical protein Plec18170_007685 [Paecilomyces lecythidis]
MFLTSFLALSLTLISSVNAAPAVAAVGAAVGVGSPVQASRYPIALQANLQIHDPSVIRFNDNYYAFTSGASLPYFKASNMSGPWEYLGTVLKGDSIIPRIGRDDPWAPNVMEYNGLFYCYYSVSRDGTRESSIGVATTPDIEHGPWTDQGEIIATGSGLFSGNYPYSTSNAIDPSVLIDPKDGQAYLAWGSYWTNIWQAPLGPHLMRVENRPAPDAVNLAYDILPGVDNAFLQTYPANREPDGTRPVEGSFMYYRAPWYYLWFSHGQCCNFEAELPPQGDEYSIRVGRSTSIRGPYVDQTGQKLTEGGGTIVYGSNSNGQVYAPGGQGIMSADENNHFDILYYHYSIAVNQSVGLNYDQAQLGYNYIDYVDGWPSVVPGVPATATKTMTAVVMATETSAQSAKHTATAPKPANADPTTTAAPAPAPTAAATAASAATANAGAATGASEAATATARASAGSDPATGAKAAKDNAAPAKSILQTPTSIIVLFVSAYLFS